MLIDVEPHGLQPTIADAKSWFDMKWPAYEPRRYKNHRRAMGSWWSRINRRELELAIERRVRIEDRKTVERLEARLPSREVSDIPDFFEQVDRSLAPNPIIGGVDECQESSSGKQQKTDSSL